MQLVNAISNNCKNNLKYSDNYSQNLILLAHHLVKSNSLFSIEKLELRELYCIINSSCNNKLMSQRHFENKFDSKGLDWRVIYTLPWKVITNTYLRTFQYKILKNILYLNKKIFVFGLSTISSYSFCNSFGENIIYFLWLYNNAMSFEKISIEIERWYLFFH